MVMSFPNIKRSTWSWDFYSHYLLSVTYKYCLLILCACLAFCSARNEWLKKKCPHYGQQVRYAARALRLSIIHSFNQPNQSSPLSPLFILNKHTHTHTHCASLSSLLKHLRADTWLPPPDELVYKHANKAANCLVVRVGLICLFQHW